MATETAQLGTVGSLAREFVLQGGDDIATRTRIDVFEDIYLVFLALGTLVGMVVIAYTLHKAYKYRAGSGKKDDGIARPQLGELPTGADKGGRKLFLSFALSAIIVVSLIGWTYGLLLYVETGAAEVQEDDIEVTVVGDGFAWQYTYHDDETLPTGVADDLVEEYGQEEVLAALREARTDDGEVDADVLADELGEDEVRTDVRTSGTMHVPVEERVHIHVTAGDVWHAFGVPELRVKADAIPGETTTTWFVAEEADEYRAECFELCGSQHSAMVGTVNAREDYEEWHDEQTIEVDGLIEQLEAGEYDLEDEENGDSEEEDADDAAVPQGVIGA